MSYPAIVREPLTESQLARCTPEAVAMAARLAARWAACVPSQRDEILSAAYLGLVLAAQRFEPGRGVEFQRFAAYRIRGEIRDALRMAGPCGFRKSVADAPRVLGLTVAGCGRGGFDRPIASPELPIGWEAEAEDAVRAICRSLPEAERESLGFYFLAAGVTLRHVGARMGLSQTRAAQIVTQALGRLREQQGGMQS